ncbi:uncharacterized protein LOC125656238 isoform X2 [Ostrea edulis]|uniref:uncharacterized protein LOC125656238 isoform X2 n=2 Tax=Ostrea edulis TaxID=37623 RepID=UPI0024AEC1E8|nr:uncharacterized protein LOC125656238 isoform X2 [Ostrea edulis]
MNFRLKLQKGGIIFITGFIMFSSIHLLLPGYRQIEWKQIMRNESRSIVLEDKTSLRLIAAYMRGGSTLMADLVRNTPADFYMFEPLHGIYFAVREKKLVQFLNGTERYISMDEVENVYVEMMYHWYTCSFDYIDLISLSSRFIKIHTPEHNVYFNCISRPKTRETKRDTVRRCITHLQTKCKRAKSRTIKTVRLPLLTVKKLIKRLPSLKVVHLNRDPRGILNSQFQLLINEGKNVTTAARELCGTMEEDLKTYEDFEFCSGRILRVIYEELCQFPFIIVPKIYNFFKITSMKRNGLRMVETKMMGPLRNCAYCTNRGDAVKTAYRWIDSISKEFLHTADRFCSVIYSKLGYLHLNYENLKITKTSWQPFREETNNTDTGLSNIH